MTRKVFVYQVNDWALDAVPALAVTGILVINFLACLSKQIVEQHWSIFKTELLFLFLAPLTISFLIQVYIGSFSIGMGAVPWVVMSEVNKVSKIYSFIGL